MSATTFEVCLEPSTGRSISSCLFSGPVEVKSNRIVFPRASTLALPSRRQRRRLAKHQGLVAGLCDVIANRI